MGISGSLWLEKPRSVKPRAKAASIISRAVLLREGRIVGDHTVDELEDAGEDLMSCIKRTYDYRGDRIQKTIRDLTEEGET